MDPVEFTADGVTLRGRLLGPVGGRPGPAVVMHHGWGATAVMGLVEHAVALADAGYVVVLYDPPCFGWSDGEPRQQLNPWARTRAMRAAVGVAADLDGVDAGRIAIWGDSGDAARVFLDAATDDRVAALMAYNPTFGMVLRDEPPSPEGFAAIREVVTHPELPPAEVVHGPAPIVDPMGGEDCMSPSPQAYRWFFEHGGRHGSGWTNTWTQALPDVSVPFRVHDCLPQVEVPALVVAGRNDEVPWCVPEVQQASLALTSGPQEFRQIDGGHFGALHHPSPEADALVELQLAFLTEYL